MIASLFFSLVMQAQAVPLQLTQQGRLLDGSGASVTGAHTLTFRLYDAQTNGTLLWSESLSVQFNNGYYATVLGSDEQNNPLDSDTLVNYPLYLEVQLDANAPMSPRQSVNSAPYAQMAGIAESVEGGTVSADEIYIGSTLVIDNNGVWQGAALTPDWSNIQTIPSGFADNTDDVLTSTQVENHIQNAQGLNLSTSTTVGGNSIVTSSTTLLPDWSNIQNKPAGFLDNTDNVLSPSDVGTYVSNNAYNLNSSTQIGGAAILTPNSNLNWNNLQNVPTGLADGDELDLLDSSCNAGEIVSWTGSNWDCVSDNTLTPNEVGTYISNNAYDLNANTTIDGATILTDVDNTLVGLGLSCQDNDVARYDATLGEWYCDADTDTNTQLSESQVETFVTNGAIGLAANSTMGGSTIVTTATDQNTQLSESEVETYITNGSVSLASGTTLNGQTIVTTATDANTQLSESQVETFVTNGSINLATGSQVNGSTIVTTATDSDTLAGLSCSIDEIAMFNGSAWVCTVQNGGSGTGLSSSVMYQRTATSAASPTAQCDDADDILISGGCDCPQTQIWSSYPVNGVDSTAVSGWTCYAGNVSVTAYAICLTQ